MCVSCVCVCVILQAVHDSGRSSTSMKQSSYKYLRNFCFESTEVVGVELLAANARRDCKQAVFTTLVILTLFHPNLLW